ncbi:DNA-directed RNA polymerase 3 subunit RPC3 [Gracilaria domingensis]|nr:DNA-directed RNA polymerase 3 subunit RPC3 [Gracilaria domingensis]
MVRQHEALACAIARYHFKPIVAEVVRLLCLHPGSTLAALTRLSSPYFESVGTRSQNQHRVVGDQQRFAFVRDSLAVLCQHAIVYYQERLNFDLTKRDAPNPGAAPMLKSRTRIHYYCDVNVLLYRPRIPLYLGFARRRFGEFGHAVLSALLERGRLTSAQLFTCTLAPKMAEFGISEAAVQACLTDMVQSGVVHWYGKRKRRSSLRAKPEARNDEAMVESVGSKRPTPHVAHYDDDDDEDDYDDEDDDRERIQIGRGDHVRSVIVPDKHNDVDIWGVCYWHLNREFRNECCLMVVGTRVSSELCIQILRVGLQIALSREDCQQPSDDLETAEVHTDDIKKGLEEFDLFIGAQEFWNAALLLAKHDPPVVVAVPPQAPTHLKFIPGRLVAETRHKTAEEFIMSRYGTTGRRIFQALALEGAMEEKSLAEKCMRPLKVVREHLFRMYQDRIIVTQEVPRSNDQQRASNWFYLWKVNTFSVHRCLLDVMYKTMLNLFLQFEMLDKDSKTPEEQKKLKNRETLLVASILRVDQSVMVMRDFGPITAVYFPSKYEVLDGYIVHSKRRRRRAT